MDSSFFPPQNSRKYDLSLEMDGLRFFLKANILKWVVSLVCWKKTNTFKRAENLTPGKSQGKSRQIPVTPGALGRQVQHGLLSDTRSITRLSRLFCRAVLWSSQSRAWLSWKPEQPDPGWAATAGGEEPSSDKSHLRQQLPQGSAFAPARSQGGFSCLSVLSPWTVFLSGLSKTPPATPGNSSKSLQGPLASKTLWHSLAF